MSPFDRERPVAGLRLVIAAVALGTLAGWNALVGAVRPVPRPATGAEGPPRLIEHERGWRDYVRGFHAHHGPDGFPEATPDDGSFRAGLLLWLEKRCLRGYTLGNHVYVCPDAPTILRVHQAGHAPAFGGLIETLVRPRRSDGGLDDEPLRTLDVMLPGDFPHTLLRLTERRDLRGTYERWVERGTSAGRGTDGPGRRGRPRQRPSSSTTSYSRPCSRSRSTWADTSPAVARTRISMPRCGLLDRQRRIETEVGLGAGRRSGRSPPRPGRPSNLKLPGS